MSKLPAIPDFVDEPGSIGTAVRAIKQVVEILSGQRQGQSLGAPSVFVQEYEPKGDLITSFKKGDQWINPLTKKMSFWDGRLWVELA